MDTSSTPSRAELAEVSLMRQDLLSRKTRDVPLAVLRAELLSDDPEDIVGLTSAIETLVGGDEVLSPVAIYELRESG